MKKRIVYDVFSVIAVALSAYLMPGFLLVAFNYGKGIQANEDGILFIPVGILLVGLTVLLQVVLVKRAWRIYGGSVRGKIAVIAVTAVIWMVSVLVTATTWELFFACLRFYRGWNVGLQR